MMSADLLRKIRTPMTPNDVGDYSQNLMRMNPGSYDSQGLEQPAIDPIMILASLMAPGVMSMAKSAPGVLRGEAGAIFPKSGYGQLPYSHTVKEAAVSPAWVESEMPVGDMTGISKFGENQEILPALMQHIKSTRGFGAQDSYMKAVEILGKIRNSVLGKSAMLDRIRSSGLN